MDFNSVMDMIFGQRIKDTVDDGLKAVDDRAKALAETADDTKAEVESVVKEAEKVAGFFQGAGPDLIALLAKTEGRIIVTDVMLPTNGHGVIIDNVQSCHIEVDQALRDELFHYRAEHFKNIVKGKQYQFIAMLVPKEGA